MEREALVLAGGPRTASAATVEVLVAHGDGLFRGALAKSLDGQPGLSVVAAVSDSEDAERQVLRLVPDVAIVDVAISPRTGIDVCASVKARDVATRVLVLSERADQSVLEAAVEAGADGYADTSIDLRGLVQAIRRLGAGEPYIPPAMLCALLRHLIRRRRDEDAALDRFARLSRREREVLALLTQGKDNRAIAEAMVVSRHTARTHVQNVIGKLEVHSRLEAAAMASRYDLLGRFGGAQDG